MGNLISTVAFNPPSSSYDNNISYLEFIIHTRHNEYKIPIRYYVKNKNLPTMLICHGNAEDIGQSNPYTLSNEFDSNICLFDYAGYGLHSNKISSEYSCRKV